MVEEAYRIYNKRVEWSVNVSRNLNYWEINVYKKIQQILAAQDVKSHLDQLFGSWIRRVNSLLGLITDI